ncbi:MAG: hypothetical protein PHC34_04110 [Candidatus Gastranaerophilales bacterium]|nr:hypothetical protein [Candidatus Gastranaerophilales bacterium]
MGISKKIVGSGLIMLAILFCQFLNVSNTSQTMQHHVSVELTGTIS